MVKKRSDAEDIFFIGINIKIFFIILNLHFSRNRSKEREGLEKLTKKLTINSNLSFEK